MMIARYVYDTPLRSVLQTQLQDSVPNKAKDLISRVDALQKHFYSPPSDVAEQRDRDELIRYTTICPIVLGAESFPVSLMTPRDNFACYTRSQGRTNSLTTFGTADIYLNSLRIYERLYLITRFVRHP